MMDNTELTSDIHLMAHLLKLDQTGGSAGRKSELEPGLVWFYSWIAAAYGPFWADKIIVWPSGS